MKKILAIIAGAALAVSLTACGGNGKSRGSAEMPAQLSPENILTVEMAANSNGGTMELSSDGIVAEGNKLTATYVGVPLGSVDTVSISLEQFSSTLSSSQIWTDYENERLTRADMQFIDGIGQDCYIAFPYICVYDRGCYIRISAGSGNDDAQKQVLVSLASQAAAQLEAAITPEQAEAASDNVIQ
ncbi:MAG: hypothetical protein ACI4DP_09175 [Candidatus Ornithomonoglobus sp.]